jgi:DNA repair protein RadD
MASLPPSLSGLVTGETENRKDVIKAYRDGRIRYLVSVGTLTTGFDVPHTQVIALLRKTESAALLQQILGRAWRLDDDKPHSVVFDYATNIEDHFPDSDIYNPVIKAIAKKAAGVGIKAKCPDCDYENTFSCQEQYKDYPIDENGYCVDVFGSRIETEYGPLSAHHGRRCQGYTNIGKELARCGYRWSGKPCPQCEELNDIAARYCYVCKAEIVDPNEKLQGEFKAMKRDPHLPQCDEVLSMECKPTVSRSGRDTLRVDFVTTYRQFSVWFIPGSAEYKRFMAVTNNGNDRPKTVGYRKVDDKFYKVHSYNLAADEPERVDNLKRAG